MIKPLSILLALTILISASFALYRKIGNDAVSAYKLEQIESNKVFFAKYDKQIKERDDTIKKQKAIYDETVMQRDRAIQSLRDDVNDGRKRLYISASCPNLSGDNSKGNARSVEEGKAELNRSVRQDYYNLRSVAVELESALQLCLKTWY